MVRYEVATRGQREDTSAWLKPGHRRRRSQVSCYTSPSVIHIAPRRCHQPSLSISPSTFRRSTQFYSTMATIEVYGPSISPFTRTVLMVLEEKGLDYQLTPVNILTGEQSKPDHLARHPFGRVPALKDGDTTVFESLAIARYLISTYPHKGHQLMGEDAKQRALTDTWIDVETNYFRGPCSSIVREKVFKPHLFNKPTDEAVVVEKTEELVKVLEVYDAHLATQLYLAGDNFTLADICHMPFLQYSLDVGVSELLINYPNVKAWWERCSTRPAWKKVLGN